MNSGEYFSKPDRDINSDELYELLLEICEKLNTLDDTLRYNIPERIVESGRKIEENILFSADKTETLVSSGFKNLSKSLQQFNEKKDSFAANLSKGHYLSCIYYIIQMFIYIILSGFNLGYLIIKMGTRYFGFLGGVLVTGLILWLIASAVSIFTFQIVSTDQILTFGINLIVSIFWSLYHCLSPLRELIFKDWRTAFLNSHLGDSTTSLVSLPSKITGLMASKIGSQLMTDSTLSFGNWFPSTFNLNTTKMYESYESFKIDDWYQTNLNMSSFKIYNDFRFVNWTQDILNLSSYKIHVEEYSYFSYLKNISVIRWS